EREIRGYSWSRPAGEARKLALLDSPNPLLPRELTPKLGSTFPHAVADDLEGSSAVGVAATPLASELLVRLVKDALAPGAEQPDLLCVSFSAHDEAAHLWGLESVETTDVLLDIDRRVGELLDELDRRYSKDGWSLVFTGDHGGPHLIEGLKSKKG